MIRLRRPAEAPTILRSKGASKAAAHRQLYDQSQPHRDGTEPFPFEEGIYQNRWVRQALELAQRGKCCYCESKSAPFEVEHFRPKGAVRQDRTERARRPGYYWLAYEWTNLLYACVLCNQPRRDEQGSPTGKGCLFPLTDPARRAACHHVPLAQEDPLLLNPYEDDPASHIGYRQYLPYGLTQRGEVTLSVLQLAGRSHIARRRDHWEVVKKMLDLLHGGPPISEERQQEVIDFLWHLAKDDAIYAAMTRAALRDFGLPGSP